MKVAKGATGVKSSVKCDALMLDEQSRSDTYPTMQVDEEDAVVAHEATVGKISDDVIHYLMSRGLKDSDAQAMVVMGFIQAFSRDFPWNTRSNSTGLYSWRWKGAWDERS